MKEQQSGFECRYILSCEDDENNLAEFLKRMSKSQWLKYKFENLDDPEDLNIVIFRMTLKAALSENDIFWRFAWEKIELFNLEVYVLKGANFEVVKFALKKHRLFIMRKAKEYLDCIDYIEMLEAIFKHAVYCHNMFLHGMVYNNVNCLNLLWDYITDDEKMVLLGRMGISNVPHLFGILSVRHLLEDKIILEFLKDKYNFQIEYSNKFFLIEKQSEAALSKFLNSRVTKEPRRKLDSMWRTTFASSTVEDQRKALLRLFLIDINSPRDKISEWAWKKSLKLKLQKFIFQGANYYAIKHILEACHRSRLERFLSEAGNHLTRSELIEMLTETVEQHVHWHGRVLDDAVVNNSESLQILLAEIGKSLKLQVFKSLKKTTRGKLNSLLKYKRLQEESKTRFANHILTNKEAENDFLKFLQAIKDREQLSEVYLNAEWNLHGLQNLSFRNRYSAIFRAFIFSIGLPNEEMFNWIWGRIDEFGFQIKVVKEQNYHLIKTVMDLSNVDLLERAIKIAVDYLYQDDIDCMFQEAYMHAGRWHGSFSYGEVWDSISCLETLKQVCRKQVCRKQVCRNHRWENIFKFTGKKFRL